MGGGAFIGECDDGLFLKQRWELIFLKGEKESKGENGEKTLWK